MPTQGSCWCLRAAKHRALGELDSLFRLALSLTTCVWKSAEFGGHPPALDTIHLLGKKAPAIDFFFPLCDFLPIYSCYQYSKIPTVVQIAGMLQVWPPSAAGGDASWITDRSLMVPQQGESKGAGLWVARGPLRFQSRIPWLSYQNMPDMDDIVKFPLLIPMA